MVVGDILRPRRVESHHVSDAPTVIVEACPLMTAARASSSAHAVWIVSSSESGGSVTDMLRPRPVAGCTPAYERTR